MNCITCNQQLPKDTTEHPHYFAQYKLKTEPDSYGDFAEELKQILEYLNVVLAMLLDVEDKDERLELTCLSRDLCREAQHRLDLVVDAAALWEQRAKITRKEG